MNSSSTSVGGTVTPRRRSSSDRRRRRRSSREWEHGVAEEEDGEEVEASPSSPPRRQHQHQHQHQQWAGDEEVHTHVAYGQERWLETNGANALIATAPNETNTPPGSNRSAEGEHQNWEYANNYMSPEQGGEMRRGLVLRSVTGNAGSIAGSTNSYGNRQRSNSTGRNSANKNKGPPTKSIV